MNGDGAKVQRIDTAQAAALTGTHRAVRGWASASHCANGMVHEQQDGADFSHHEQRHRRRDIDAEGAGEASRGSRRCCASASGGGADPAPGGWTAARASPRTALLRRAVPSTAPAAITSTRRVGVVESRRRSSTTAGPGGHRETGPPRRSSHGEDPPQGAAIPPTRPWNAAHVPARLGLTHAFVHAPTLGEAPGKPEMGPFGPSKNKYAPATARVEEPVGRRI